MAPRTYFAARSKRDIGEFLVGKLQECNNLHDEGRGVREEERNAYRHYYGRELGMGTTTGVTRKGEQGEIASVRVNFARALAKALLALVTGPKLTWRPIARNSDAGAQKANSIAKHLLEDYWKNRGMDRVVQLWAEQAIAMASAFVFPEWDLMAGPTFAALPPSREAPNGRLVKAGDITFHNILPWNVFKDERRQSWEGLDWKFIRIEKNRWDLAKVYHQLADGSPSLDAILSAQDPLSTHDSERDEDIAVVYYFFHRPTPSLPVGREIIFLDSRCVLQDRRLTYDEVPVYRLAADEMFGTPNAWSQFWDVLGVQELADGAHEAVATNVTTLGGQIVAMEQGTDETRLVVNASGVRVLRYPRGGQPPQGVNLVRNPPEVFKYLEQLQAWQRQLMGLNDVALGQPQSAQMNAQAFAVLASMAVQQASPFQTALVRAVSQLGSGVLATLRKRVTMERKLEITGATSKHLYSEEAYTGKDLAPVKRVIVEVGNPMEQTPTGRTLILQDLIKVGAIVSADDYFQVLDTGRLEPALRAERDEKLLIASEYEDLSQGINPPVHTYQNHPLHFRENASVLANPEALRNPDVVRAVQAHCDAHYVEFFGLPPGTDPRQDPLYLDRIRLMLGQEPPGVSMPPPPPPDAGGPVEPSAPEGLPLPPDPAAGQTPDVVAPSMPINPLTGAEFDPATGGGMLPPPM